MRSSRERALVPTRDRRRRRRQRGKLVRCHGRGGLVDAAEFNTIRRDRLSALCDKERASALSGDDAEAAKHVCDEADKPARAASGVSALRGDGDGGFEIGRGAKLGGNDGV
jgi:predicted dinucleotide-binding enzyme